MNFRKLRIAWSVFWGVPAVLLFGLLIMSYSVACATHRNFDDPKTPFQSQGIQISSNWGVVTVESHPDFLWPHSYGWKGGTYAAYDWSDAMQNSPGRSQFYWESSTADCVLSAPHWFLIIVFGSVAILPWLRLRFSLRTLLIATTLVAVVLGLVTFFGHRSNAPPLDEISPILEE